MQTSQVFIDQCTVVSPLVLLLFGGDFDVLHSQRVGAMFGFLFDSQVAVMDGWLRVSVCAKTALVLRCVRAHIRNLISSKLEKPEMSSDGDRVWTECLKAPVVPDAN
jgi:hypothetical protein